MNKQEQSVMDEFVNRHNGVNEFGAAYFEINGIEFTSEQFNQRAIELGWINGYKWGVEYQTNGKKPGLPDDLIVETNTVYSRSWLGGTSVYSRLWQLTEKFRIVDLRYKPKEPVTISHFAKAGGGGGGITIKEIESSWHERGELPPVGVECDVTFSMAPVGISRDTQRVRITPVYYRERHIIYKHKGNEYTAYLDSIKFYPIKAYREIFVEYAMVQAMSAYQGGDACSLLSDDDFEYYFGKLYDAGCRFVSQESSS